MSPRNGLVITGDGTRVEQGPDAEEVDDAEGGQHGVRRDGLRQRARQIEWAKQNPRETRKDSFFDNSKPR